VNGSVGQGATRGPRPREGLRAHVALQREREDEREHGREREPGREAAQQGGPPAHRRGQDGPGRVARERRLHRGMARLGRRWRSPGRGHVLTSSSSQPSASWTPGR
jgi:hypothetical protein